MTEVLEGRVLRRAADRVWVATSVGEKICFIRRGIVKDYGPLVVGDRVEIGTSEVAPQIEKIFKRNNYLPRPHLANISQAVVVSAFREPPINTVLMDRLLVIAQTLEIGILIVFNKMDLRESPEMEIFEKYQGLGYPTLQTCAKKGEGLEALESHLRGSLSVFLGASGVGKTSLLRALDPTIVRQVGELSRERRHGSHTTTRSEIFLLKNDMQSAIADTPGFDWLTLLPNSPAAITNGFPEFKKVGSCRFQDCRHLQEPDCAVRAAVGTGTIWESRHKSYTMLMKELESKPKSWEQKDD